MDAGEEQKVWILCTIMFRHEMGDDNWLSIDIRKLSYPYAPIYKIFYIAQNYTSFLE